MPQRSKHQVFAFCLIALLFFVTFFLTNHSGQAASKRAPYNQTLLTPSPTYSQGYSAPIPIVLTPQFISGNYRISLPLISYSNNFTISYYVQDINTMNSLGCETGKTIANLPSKKGFVILDFGAPAFDVNPINGQQEYGTYLLTYARDFIPRIQMYGAVTAFMDGYEYCASQIGNTHLDLAIGVNNANNPVMRDSTMRLGHAAEFGAIVRNLDNYSTNYLGDLIRVSYAMDVEHDPADYADPEPTIQWIRKALASSGKPFYNFGNADCSMNFPVGNEINVQPGMCGPAEAIGSLKWTQAHIATVSSLEGWGYPIPEIYTTDGANAMQWYRIGIYGSMKNTPLTFRGVLTQLTACKQVGCATGTNNDPDTGFSQMSKYVATLKATDTRVGNEMQWRTDMMYQSEPIP